MPSQEKVSIQWWTIPLSILAILIAYAPMLFGLALGLSGFE